MTNTTHYNLVKPDPANDIDEEFLQLQQTLDQIDTALHAHDQSIAGKANEDHGHPISEIAGLPEALAAKMPANQTFSLDSLTDVDGAAAASAGYLLVKTPTGWVPAAPGAALGDHEHPISKIIDLQATLDSKANTSSMATALDAKLDDSQLDTDGTLAANNPGKIPAQSAVKTYVDTKVMAAGTPVGTIVYFATSTAPDGYLVCNGAAVSTVYPDLRTLLINAGSPFGTSGADPKLPDLRGEFMRGWDNGRGVDTGRVFGSSQLDAFQGHRHAFSLQDAATSPSGGALDPLRASGATSNNNKVLDPITDGTNGAPRTASETRPRNIAMLPCIKAFGTVSVAGMADLSALLNAIATQAQAEAGTDNTKLMTPLRTKQAVNAGKAAYIHVRDQKASGVAGGSNVAGLNVRTLNTVVFNGVTGASLSANKINLPTGTYYINARCPAFACNRTVAWLRTASGTILAYGSTGYALATGSCYDSFIVGKFTLSANTDVEIVQYCQTVEATNGLGVESSSAIPEVYTDVVIERID